MPTHSIVQQLKDCKSSSRVFLLTEYLRESLADFFEFDDKEEIAVNQDFVALGISSMEAVNYKTALEDVFQCALKTTLFFDFPTLDILVNFLLTDILDFEVEVSEKETQASNEQGKVAPLSEKEKEQIVIIAIDGMFPNAMSPDKLWEQSIISKKINKQGTNDSFHFNELLEPVYPLNLGGLGITEAMFATMPKQQKISFTTINTVINDSRIPLKDLTTSKTGIFFASDTVAKETSSELPYSVPLANEISFKLNFNGPSEIVNTFCTSIYVALHRGIQSIQANECEQAIIGGVNVISKQEFQNSAKQGIYNDLLSKDETFSFSDQANGFVRSEGAGALLITTLSKALKYNTKILAVVKASNVAHGGKNFSLEAPKAAGIKDMIASCLQQSGIAANTIDYIEAHGIANPMADAIELSSIHNSYTLASNSPDKKWNISTVKPIVGHPELVSGIASLIKVIKAFEHNIIPGIPNLQTVNTEIPTDNNLIIQKEASPWVTENPKRAALNSYAIGGVNAHLILEEYKKGVVSKDNQASVILVNVNEEHEVYVEKEKVIKETIIEVFNLKKIDRSLSPMDYGFDSIKIVQFIRRVNENLNIEIKIGEALGVQTFEEFFKLAGSKKQLNTSLQQKLSSEISLTSNFSHETTLFQKGLWFAHELDPLSVTYNLPVIFEVKKDIQSNIVLQTIAFLFEKHPVLRVYFENDEDQIIQKIHSISHGLHIDTDTFVTSFTEEFKKLAEIPFNLKDDCLVRTYVRVEEKTNKQFLGFIIHHAILDGLSGTLFMKLFWEIYFKIEKGEKIYLNEIDTCFFDFASREQQYMLSEQANIDLQWWENQLNNSAAFELPYDHPQNVEVPYQNKEIVSTQITGDELASLKEAALSMKVSMSVLLMAAFKILLYKLTQQKDIVVASPTEGRQKTQDENSLGCFVNVLLVRSELDQEKTLFQNISNVKDNFLNSLDYSAYPLTDLLTKLAENDNSETIKVPVSYTYQNIFDSILEDSALKDTIVPSYDVYQQTQDEYAVEVYDFRDTLQVNFKYKKNLFEASTIKKHLSYFKKIVHQFIEDKELLLSELNILSEKEENLLLTNFDNTHIGYPEQKTLVTIFEEQVLKAPSKIAVTYNDNQISYQDLNKRVNQLARFLQKRGISKNDSVVLCFDRSIDMIIGILAVAKTGAAYIPVDPLYPANRILYTINDATPKSVLCDAFSYNYLSQIDTLYPIININEAENDIKQQVPDNLHVVINPKDPLYVIYTSGTTGNPKGVQVSHTNVVRLLKTEQPLFNFNENDVWSLFHSYCFDFSVWEMYGALLFGGRLVIVSDKVRKDTVLFGELLVSEKVTVLNQTPSSFYALQEQIDTFPENLNIRYVIFGGEALQPSILQNWNTKYQDCKLINMYGITETTVHVTYKEITSKEINHGGSVIGLPIPTLSCYVLDENKKLLPQGVPGELYVGGKGVALGYLNRPELTKERFVKNPFTKKGNVYKTGDVVKWNYNNELEYVGRIDDQVKIRGYRIELAEIEHVLLKNPNILQCIVIAVETIDTNKELVAYVKYAKAVDEKSVLSFLESQIPQYMVPRTLIAVDQFELTSNGKINKKKLPIYNLNKNQQNYVAPINETEKVIVNVFEEVLKKEKVGTLDSFFDLGGHSLLVMKTLQKINKELQSKLTAQHLFRYANAKELTYHIEHNTDGNVQVNLSNELNVDIIDELPITDFVFSNSPKHIFVTGGTGFVGAFLLKELLENTSAILYCLTRAKSKQEAFSKIKNIMTSYNLWSDKYATRIESVVGDIGLPLLGLGQELFDRLSNTIDVIYHNAAHMNHMATYQDLKTANVLGTIELLKLATKNKIKPLHYTSTLAIFNNTVREEVQLISEKTTSEKEIHYENDGYPASKWVGENIILKAQKQGLPCAIYRLGLTIGDSEKGRLDHKQWFYEFIKSCISSGTMINEDLNIKLPMMPVNMVANSLVSLSLKKESLNQTFHLVGNPISLYDIFKNFNELNNNVLLKELSMYSWLKNMKSKSGFQIPPFMLEYLELSEEELNVRKNNELKAKLIFDTSFTEKELAKNNIFFTGINDKTSFICLHYVIEKENLKTHILA